MSMNIKEKTRIRKMFMFIISLIYILNPTYGAIISGTIYDWYTLEPKSNVIITINTTPEQKLISKNGEYMFNVSYGSYTLIAEEYEKGKKIFQSSENITINKEGKYVIDLILFPVLDENETLGTIEDVNLENTIIVGNNEPTKNQTHRYIIILILLIVAILLCYKYCHKLLYKFKKEDKDNLDEETQKVLNIIKKQKRIKQRDLRKELKFSDSKLSLILIDLENRQLIRKIKKGRGNIIYLNK